MLPTCLAVITVLEVGLNLVDKIVLYLSLIDCEPHVRESHSFLHSAIYSYFIIYYIVYIVLRTGSLAGRVGDWHFGGFESLTMLYFVAILEVLS